MRSESSFLQKYSQHEKKFTPSAPYRHCSSAAQRHFTSQNQPFRARYLKLPMRSQATACMSVFLNTCIQTS